MSVIELIKLNKYSDIHIPKFWFVSLENYVYKITNIVFKSQSNDHFLVVSYINNQKCTYWLQHYWLFSWVYHFVLKVNLRSSIKWYPHFCDCICASLHPCFFFPQVKVRGFFPPRLGGLCIPSLWNLMSSLVLVCRKIPLSKSIILMSYTLLWAINVAHVWLCLKPRGKHACSFGCSWKSHIDNM